MRRAITFFIMAVILVFATWKLAPGFDGQPDYRTSMVAIALAVLFAVFPDLTISGLMLILKLLIWLIGWAWLKFIYFVVAVICLLEVLAPLAVASALMSWMITAINIFVPGLRTLVIIFVTIGLITMWLLLAKHHRQVIEKTWQSARRLSQGGDKFFQSLAKGADDLGEQIASLVKGKEKAR